MSRSMSFMINDVCPDPGMPHVRVTITEGNNGWVRFKMTQDDVVLTELADLLSDLAGKALSYPCSLLRPMPSPAGFSERLHLSAGAA